MKLDYPMSADHPLITQLWDILARNTNNYFTKPSIQSPVPQTQMPTAFQQNMNQIGNILMPQAYAPTHQVQHPILPIQKAAIPQVQAATVDPYADFTSSKVPQQYAGVIAQAAQANGINPALLASLLFTESGIQPGKVNTNKDKYGNASRDRGIAQINDVAHPEVTDQQANDPNFAIPWAAKNLGGHIKQLGMQRGIVAYNTGANGALSVPDPKQHKYYKAVTGGLSQGLRSKLGL